MFVRPLLTGARIRTAAGLLLAAALTNTAVAEACSGPRAHETMLRSQARGWSLFVVTAIVAAIIVLSCVLLKRQAAAALLAVGLAASHPASWLSAYGGDCGMLRNTLTVAWLVMVVLIAGFVVVRSFRPDPQH